MHIVRPGTYPHREQDPWMHGECASCGCRVNFRQSEARVCMSSMFVKCPTTGCPMNIAGQYQSTLIQREAGM